MLPLHKENFSLVYKQYGEGAGQQGLLCVESVWILSGDSGFLPQTGTDFRREYNMDTCWSRDVSPAIELFW